MHLIGSDLSQRLPLWTGYGLTTAEILYRLPDHPTILQSYLWQDYDVTPTYPALQRFLAFWRGTLDGALHSVRVAHTGLVTPSELRAVGHDLLLQ